MKYETMTLIDLLRWTLLAIVVFVTHFQEAITGFGCTVLALPFVVLLLGIHSAVKVLVIQAWILTGCIVWRAREQIAWDEYARIVTFALPGFAVGIHLFTSLPENTLKVFLGTFMGVVALRGLAAQFRRRNSPERTPTRFARFLLKGLLVIGGAIHGAFGSGGPCIIVYATHVIRHKGMFRATLCTLWFTLNSILVLTWAYTRALQPEIWTYTAICTPFTIIGMVLGDRCHRMLDEESFKTAVFTVLLLSGAVIIYTAIHSGR
ncbi:MAG: sulfite exporter TauE/SafE family protein [Armatimonadota bacterium]|nr:sulfite exporter TauE/SafE family protein [Armatimonadota bacterium]